MARDSRNSPHYSYAARRGAKRAQHVVDEQIEQDIGRSYAHRYTVFRLNWDACAKCGKPRAEHQVSDANGDI
jgi:hypothetical protein